MQVHVSEALQRGQLRGRQETEFSEESHQPELPAPLVCSTFESNEK